MSDQSTWTPPAPGDCGSLSQDCDGTNPQTWCRAAGVCGQAALSIPPADPTEEDR